MVRETRTLKTLFPEPKPPSRKNFIKENVKSVRRMEKFFHSNNSNGKDLQLPVPRLEQMSTRKKSAPVISSKKTPLKKFPRSSANPSILKKNHAQKNQLDHKNEVQQKLKAHSTGDVAHSGLNSETSDADDLKSRSQGVQTLDSSDIGDIYTEGVIRYPSGKMKETQKSRMSEGDTNQECDELEAKNISDRSSNVDYVKLNKERVSLASKLVSQLHNTPSQPSHRIGVVPKYIKERKQVLEKEQSAKASAKLSDCPTGHVPLPDNERRETLGMLRKNYHDYVDELNALPIRTDTLKSQKRKMEIEKQLAKLEEAIKVFTRPKVFVRVDS
ncbi:hypothetical protein QAD02_016826 [Eretmocerus hayati]|uniref:Uncharacterized protein n=1 Tax=Eretmocerus hayati TaxID=131215 RepID=A0ACC2PBN5_9HYME|nr:hypothetical protein QAD02_016826 [Eretmocerus hayati]